MFPYPITGLATLFIIAVYVASVLKVSTARWRYGVQAPATSGNDDFERVFRVQQNNVEQLIVFLPCLWLFALTYNDLYVGILGFVFGVSRIAYARAYYAEAKKRGIAFTISFLCLVVAFVGALWGLLCKTGLFNLTM